MTRKKKDSKEIKDMAQEIASIVVVTSDEELPKKKASKKTPVVSEEPLVVESVEAVVPIARKAPIQNVKVKATASVRGVYGKMRYEIKAGEIYTFPEPMAKWLISIGRAI